MEFNGGKFVALRYGSNKDIINYSNSITEEMDQPIDALDNYKELGILMS